MNDLTDDQLTLTIRAVQRSLIEAENRGMDEKAEILRNAADKLKND